MIHRTPLTYSLVYWQMAFGPRTVRPPFHSLIEAACDAVRLSRRLRALVLVQDSRGKVLGWTDLSGSTEPQLRRMRLIRMSGGDNLFAASLTQEALAGQFGRASFGVK